MHAHVANRLAGSKPPGPEVEHGSCPIAMDHRAAEEKNAVQLLELGNAPGLQPARRRRDAFAVHGNGPELEPVNPDFSAPRFLSRRDGDLGGPRWVDGPR